MRNFRRKIMYCGKKRAKVGGVFVRSHAPFDCMVRSEKYF